MRAVYSLILILIVTCLSSQIVWAEIGYTVKDGDTLTVIADKFGVTVEELAKENNIETDSILSIDQRLVIPYAKDEPALDQSSKPTKYTIKKGDCLDTISKQFGCSIDELAELNEIKRTTVLKIGQVLVIPKKIEKSQKVITPTKTDNPDKFKKEVSVDVEASKIHGKNLLDLSQLDGADVTVIDLDEQAEEKKPEEEVKASEPPVIRVSNKVVAPEGQPFEKPAEKPKPKSDEKPKYIEYKIQKGDSVSRIAKKFDVSESQIFDANGISKRTTLRVGKTLKIPTGPALERRTDEKLISRNLATRDRLVRKALEYKGVRYIYGGASLSSGVDCSGFTMKVYEKFGINLPHSSSEQSGHGKKVNRSELLPGDLVFFGSGSRINHVGIYIGNGQILHASTSLRRISIDNLSEDYFSRHYVTARRIL